ncbi:MAG: hypothetical protein H6553_04965 [Chitinophagales bacterium]|nr:hypothetical protein [Chitinophagales bacterium]
MINEADYEIVIQFEDTYPKGLYITIYKNENTYVKKCVYKNTIVYLPLGSGDNIKFKDGSDKTFFVSFKVDEAKKYGFIIPCNYNGYIEPYKNLSCNPDDLVMIEELYKEEFLGYKKSNRLYECPKCKKQWLITEEYDSHRGHTINCILKK